MAPGTEGKGGIAGLQCSFENEAQFIATFQNAPVIYFINTENEFGNPWTNTSLAGSGWNNQMSAFSTDFSVSGSPRLVGGLQPMAANQPGWLECDICTSAVDTLWDDDLIECDAVCISVVEAAGGGPEDPIADFVAAACTLICEKWVSKAESSTNQAICYAAHMCSSA